MKIRNTIYYIARQLALAGSIALVPVAHAAMPQNYGGGMPYNPMTGYPQQAMSPGVYTVMATPQGGGVILGGSVVANREVTLAAQVPGRVELIAGKEGDWFEPGAVMVSLSDDVLEAQRNQALAQLGSADSMMQNSRVQYSRELWAPRSRDIGRLPGMGLPSMFDQFFTRGFGSNMGYGNPWLERQADLYGQGAQVQQSQSQVMQAHAGVDAIEAQLRDARSVAPFAGVLTKKFVESGDTVQPGQPLVTIADVSRLQIQVEVPVRQVGSLQIGMSIPARIDAVGQLEARVAQIFPAANASRHTVTVKLDLPSNVHGGPGLYAEVMLPDGNGGAAMLPVIPETATLQRGSLPSVMVLDVNNVPRMRLVRLGEPLGNGLVQVLSGLRPGERILANPRQSGGMPQAR